MSCHIYFLSESLELGRDDGLEVSFNLDLDCVLGRNDAAAGGSNPRAFWRESSHLKETAVCMIVILSQVYPSRMALVNQLSHEYRAASTVLPTHT